MPAQLLKAADVVLVNRSEPLLKRLYMVAKELLPPSHIRAQQVANKFPEQRASRSPVVAHERLTLAVRIRRKLREHVCNRPANLRHEPPPRLPGDGYGHSVEICRHCLRGRLPCVRVGPIDYMRFKNMRLGIHL